MGISSRLEADAFHKSMTAPRTNTSTADVVIEVDPCCQQYEDSGHALAELWRNGVGPGAIEKNRVAMFGARPPRPFPRGGSVSVVDGGYRYSEGGAYVNFGAKTLGGGVLGRVFVQEEICTFESNLLLLFHANYVRGNALLNGVVSTDLSMQPQSLGTQKLFRLKASFYGHEGREKLHKVDPHDVGAWCQNQERRSIYWVCMAAANSKDMGGPSVGALVPNASLRHRRF